MYGADMAPGSAGFANFLRKSLRDFGGASRERGGLVAHSTAKTELWHIRIPKVPRSQVVEAVFWSVKKEKQFDEKEFSLDFEVQGEVVDKGVAKLNVMVYLVPRKELDEIQHLFNDAGIKLSGLTVSPIGVQTMFRSNWVPAGSASYAHLFVGRNWSRIDIFIGGDLVLSRGIKAGSNSMIEALMDNYNLQSGQQAAKSGGGGDDVISLSLEDPSAARKAGGGGGGGAVMDFDQARTVLWSKLLGFRGGESGPGAELNEIDTLKMIRPAAERLIRQVERTFEYHTTTMGNERVEKIFFSGELATNQMLIKYIHSQLGIECQVLDALSPSSPGVPKNASQMSPVDRLSYNLAVALALSDNSYTPNLLYTYRDKERVRQAKKMDVAIHTVSFIILLILGGVFVWQMMVVKQKQHELDGIRGDINSVEHKVDAAGLEAFAQEISTRNRMWKLAAQRYEGLAVISEINDICRDHPAIKLTSLSLNLGEFLGDTGSGARSVIIEGFISTQERRFELEFTTFQIEIERSSMFELPVIVKKEIERHPSGGRVLSFIIHFNLQSE